MSDDLDELKAKFSGDLPLSSRLLLEIVMELRKLNQRLEESTKSRNNTMAILIGRLEGLTDLIDDLGGKSNV